MKGCIAGGAGFRKHLPHGGAAASVDRPAEDARRRDGQTNGSRNGDREQRR